MRPRVFGFLALLSVLLSLPACLTGQPTPGGPVSTIVADCAAEPIRNVAIHLLDDVASALLTSGDWRDALKAVAVRAGQNGVPAVNCAVTHLWTDAEKKLTARARMDEETAKRQEQLRDRAKEYLSAP